MSTVIEASRPIEVSSREDNVSTMDPTKCHIEEYNRVYKGETKSKECLEADAIIRKLLIQNGFPVFR